MPRSLRLVAFAIVAPLCTVSTVLAGGISEETQTESFQFPLSPGTTTLTFQQFDDLGGARTLEKVTLSLDAVASLQATAENTQPIRVFGLALNVAGFLNADGGGLSVFGGYNETVLGDVLEPDDGVPGQGADFWDFGVVTADVIANNSSTTDLDAFIGADSFDVDVFGTASVTLSPAFIAWVISNFAAAGEVVITYEYADGGECTGDIDDSGDVGFTDLLSVLSFWGPCDDCPEDLDMSGAVDFTDLLTVLAFWGPCSP